MKVLLDNGHGVDTPGKRSPDGKFREYAFAREIAKRVEAKLKEHGVDVQRIVPEEEDISLGERTRRVNDICVKYGVSNCILISIHANAAGSGQWLSARGWSAYTTKGRTASDTLATYLYKEAEKQFKGMTIRTDYQDGDPDWEENFWVLRKSLCPAVLTENFFQDNKEDVAFLMSEEGKEKIVNCHVNGILEYLFTIQ